MDRKIRQKVRNWPRIVSIIDILVPIVFIVIAIGGSFFYSDKLAIASLDLSLVVTYLTTVRPLMRKPRLEMFIDNIRCSAPTLSEDTASWFMRLGIVNYGLTSANNCMGRIVGVWTEEGKQIEKFDPLTLYWSRQDSTHTGFNPVEIQGYGDVQYLDVGQVKKNDLTPLTLRVVLKPPMILSKGENDSPSPGSNPSLRSGTYYIQVAIYANEANVHPTWLEISCSENISECDGHVPCSVQKRKPSFA